MKKFFKGLIIGGVIGYLTGIFTAPKKGKEMRKDLKKKIDDLQKLMKEKNIDKKVKEIFGTVSETTKSLYFSAQIALLDALADLKGRLDNLDLKEYKKVLNQTLTKIQKNLNLSENNLENLRKNFLRRFEEFKKAAQKKQKDKTSARKVSRKN